ncbi:MAG: 6,7-dimethyl-8-ribityllumazine synthase [Saprospiraceae bacterium]
MASANKNLSDYNASTMPDAGEMTFGIVVADWNQHITHALYEGAYDTLIKHNASPDHIHTVQVPGAFELTTGARMLAGRYNCDAIICLGCVIKGETSHNEYINQAVAHGLTNLGLTTGKAFIFGLLTPNDEQQALDRAGGQYGNKGVEAATTAIRMAALRKELQQGGKQKIGFGA